jgi:acetyltransferase-like isoleucine patch superfamily enzyme
MVKKFKEFLILKILGKDQFRSKLLRKYFYKKYKIKVGLYSYGCFSLKRIPAGTTIGRYCSFAPTSYIFNGNHGVEFISTHAFLYNPNLGVVKCEKIKRKQLFVSDDVWIGHNAIILPSVASIGRGAIIGAGAIVTKDVPPYSVVAGNPARIVKFRFTPEIISKIEDTKWWEKDLIELMEDLKFSQEKFYNPSNFWNNYEV